MNQYDHLRPVGNRSLIGCGKVVLSMKLGDFVDWKLFLRSPAIKTAFFMATVHENSTFHGQANLRTPNGRPVSDGAQMVTQTRNEKTLCNPHKFI